MSDTLLNEFLREHQKIILKPSLDSSGGRNISVFDNNNGSFVNSNGEILNFAFLKNNYPKNYIIQEWINQNEFYSSFNPTSVNTIRIHTYKSVKNDDIIILNAYLRIGKKGNSVDNQSAGGVVCNIKLNNQLDEFALDKKAKIKIFESNGIKFSEVGRLPEFDLMKEIAIKIAKKNYYSRIIGFDFCVNKDNKVILIEINNQFAGISLQMNSGPFFGNYTDEVVEYCKTMKFD
jgi:glutathione synthase/RimK-type ligase-like ATP-grasp enzyme